MILQSVLKLSMKWTNSHIHTYILYIHTTAVIILKNDKNKIHTFYKVLTRASTSADDWYHDVHSKLADFGMHINTNALLYPPPPVRTGSSLAVCPFSFFWYGLRTQISAALCFSYYILLSWPVVTCQDALLVTAILFWI